MRTVLITGVSSDIGLAAARRYLAAGWRVIGHYRSMRPELAALMTESQDRFEGWQADFADTVALEAKLAAEPEFFIRADALVNLAAALPAKRFEEASAADILSTLAVNLVPGLLLMRLMGPAMVERGFGRILHASSIGVKFGGGGDSFCYSLSKHAQEFIPSAARKWAAAGVLVNVLRIGVTDTRSHEHIPGKNMTERTALIPAKRMATPDEIAGSIFWLASEDNGFTTAQVIAASGGE
jgi:NAD(P)-dependent dehydrogenase (short-subunit alcohol dehydrogenase family)